MKVFAFVAALALGAPAAQAATTIVNLNAGPTNPNAGKSSGGFPYNPVNVSLAAGSYSVQVVGRAGGGLYDAYAVYADNGSNAAFTDSMWTVSLNNGTTAAYTQANLGRSNTAAAALATYSAVSPYVFSLNTTTLVSFYVDDSAQPYFADDSGGVSLAVSSVPEPASLALLGLGIVGAAFGLRRRAGSAAA